MFLDISRVKRMIINNLSYENILKNTHPMEKFLFSMGTLIITITMDKHFISLLIFIVMNSILILKIKLNLKSLLKLYSIPFLFVILSIIPLIISFDFKQISISKNNLKYSINLILKVFSAISCTYFFIISTPMNDMDIIMEKFKMPSIFRELFMLTYRYIFLLIKFSQEIFISQKSRSGYKNYKTSFNSLSLLIVQTFNKSLRHSLNADMALKSRSISNQIQFMQRKYKINKKNYIYSIIWFISIISLGMII